MKTKLVLVLLALLVVGVLIVFNPMKASLTSTTSATDKVEICSDTPCNVNQDCIDAGMTQEVYCGYKKLCCIKTQIFEVTK